jgi:hypothetical protein
MSSEKPPINDYEDTPGKPESKTDWLPPASSANDDKLQQDLKNLRGDYGQTVGHHAREDMGEPSTDTKP